MVQEWTVMVAGQRVQRDSSRSSPYFAHASYFFQKERKKETVNTCIDGVYFLVYELVVMTALTPSEDNMMSGREKRQDVGGGGQAEQS